MDRTTQKLASAFLPQEQTRVVIEYNRNVLQTQPSHLTPPSPLAPVLNCDSQYPHLTQNPPITGLLCILSKMHPYKTTAGIFHNAKGTHRQYTLKSTPHTTTTKYNPPTKPHPLLYHHRFPPFLLPSPIHPQTTLLPPAMANASLQSFLLQHHHSFLNSTVHEASPAAALRLTTNASTSISFKLFSSSSSSVTTASTAAPTPVASAATSPPTPSLELLGQQLAEGDYRQADETTRALLIHLAGEPARRRGYVFFSEVQFISVEDLRAIDELWMKHSNGKFGYSVQRRVWEKSLRDYTRLFIKIGWMKKLDSEVLQYNYRAFPDEFIWELNDDTPEGHLPLTNALRGTRLMENIFTHPAFDLPEEEAAEEEDGDTGSNSGQNKDDNKVRVRPKIMTTYKPNYSF